LIKTLLKLQKIFQKNYVRYFGEIYALLEIAEPNKNAALMYCISNSASYI